MTQDRQDREDDAKPRCFAICTMRGTEPAGKWAGAVRWLCSCGSVGRPVTASRLGSAEERALRSWRLHRAGKRAQRERPEMAIETAIDEHW